MSFSFSFRRIWMIGHLNNERPGFAERVEVVGMSFFRLFLLGLLVVCAVGAMSGPASAETCTGGSHFVGCNDHLEPLAGETGLGTGGLALFVIHLAGGRLEVHCLSGDYQGTLGKLGAASGLGLLLNCTELLPTGCELSANQKKEIDFVFTTQLESATLATVTGDRGGGTHEFTPLEIVNCSIAGNYTVTGTQMVSIPKGGESKVEQEIVATKAQSALKLGTELASFSTTTSDSHLGGTLNMVNLDLAWLVMAGE